jgi:hypothetical protein
MMFYHRFYFPWYFSSWASGEPHHSGFKSQIVTLSLWCVMFQVLRFLCRESVYCCPGTVSRFFKLLLTVPVASMIASMAKQFMFHIRWISILRRFLYFNLFSASFCIILIIFIIIIIIINLYGPMTTSVVTESNG